MRNAWRSLLLFLIVKEIKNETVYIFNNDNARAYELLVLYGIL